MKTSQTVIALGLAAGLVVLALVAAYRTLERRPLDVLSTPPDAPVATAPTKATAIATPNGHQGFLYGRVTTGDGETFEGRLRWGGDEEAFWNDTFTGYKMENPWAAQVPAEQLQRYRTIRFLGVQLARLERPIDLDRPFRGRFGDIARIEAQGHDLRVTLKRGTTVSLDRLAADDFADGVRVWDPRHGVVDLEEGQIRQIDFLPTPRLDAAPNRLHGTVHSRQGTFTGFVRWNRDDCLGTDELGGQSADGVLSLPFRTIRRIAQRSQNSSRVTLTDGREVVLTDTREVGRGHRGVIVDDPRLGRVEVSWDAFERVDFSPSEGVAVGSGPAYGDFLPGSSLTGQVTTPKGRLEGRLVYDLDESETTDTLDGSDRGLSYILPFGRIAWIVPADGDSLPARVHLHSGLELRLERSGDLGENHGGLLVFIDGRERPEYVPWRDVERIDFDRPPGLSP